MGKAGTVFGLIGIILGAGGIAFGFFNMNSQNNNLTQSIVVGIWDGLAVNLDFTPHNSNDDWLIEFEFNKLNNTDYISVSNNNTRITLLKTGWYRIQLSMFLNYLDPDTQYYIKLLKDGLTEGHIHFYETETSSTASSYYYIDSSEFVYSDGTNYIEINGFSYTDNSFSIGSDIYNQFKIEYIAT